MNVYVAEMNHSFHRTTNAQPEQRTDARESTKELACADAKRVSRVVRSDEAAVACGLQWILRVRQRL